MLPDETNREFVDALARGLDILLACSDAGEGLTLAEVARRTDTTRASARRSLITLIAKGYLVSDGRLFHLTPKVLSLAAPMLAAPIARRAQAILGDLSQRFGESVSLAMLAGDDIVYVARSETRRIVALNLTVGSHLPAWCTSMGRVLLAGLPAEERIQRVPAVLEARTPYTLTDRDALLRELAAVSARGYTVLDEELELGLRSLAVPIARSNGQVCAALNVGTQSGRTSVDTLKQDFLPVLQEAARLLSAAFD